MTVQMKPKSTPTPMVREPSTPRSTERDREIGSLGPQPDYAVGLGWTLDIPVSRMPDGNAVLRVVMTFGGGTVCMEAVDIGVSAEGRTATEVYGRLVKAVGSYLVATGGDAAALLSYEPDTWFKFVPPKTVAERLEEAYGGDELEPQEREFLDLTREHFSRLDDE